ncbi:MAG: protein-L-isoaspartate O-methyltransferase [Betaproteobacteria bacterium]|nr:protein-L-isoaspartate O-methyltransferase [Betaproteobacteria bacterium]
MDLEKARFNMVEQQIRPWEVLDQEVLDLLFMVKREDFVPAAYRNLAFADVEIPLGHGAAMLEPKVEARLLQALHLRHSDKVLVVGAGSGHLMALVAARADHVIGVEIEPELAQRARENLVRAGVVDAVVEVGDGSAGWPARAPYDVIIVAAGVPEVPSAMLEQLKPGGRLFAFVGEEPVMSAQLVTRVGEAAFRPESLFETWVTPLRTSRPRDRFVF